MTSSICVPMLTKEAHVPQASKKLRKKMIERFGSLDASGPQKFLENAGYVLTPAWMWEPKPGLLSGNLQSEEDFKGTKEEYDAIIFLIEEWDYGGLIWPGPTT